MAVSENRELGELLSSLVSSPDIMGKLLSALGGTAKSSAEPLEEASEATADEGASVSEVAAAAPTRQGSSRREGLLRALRPYLSKNRCKRLDHLIRLSPMLNYLHTDRNL